METLETLRNSCRIHVTGNVAAGKSTVGEALGTVLGLPVTHMDTLVWLPGWKKRPENEKHELVVAAAAGNEWIIDGVSEHVRHRCDAIVFIDLTTSAAVWRAIIRVLRLGRGHRPELGPDFPELRAACPALRLARRFNRRVRPGIVSDLTRIPVVVRVTSGRQVRDLVGHLRSTASTT